MRDSCKLIALLAIVASSGWHLTGCSDPGGELVENKPPTVWLSSAPPEGTVESYTIKMNWGGWDPDGEVSHYEFCITDNDRSSFNPADTVGPDKWHRVYSNDSTFTFTADVLVDTNTTDLVTDFTRSHTFFIRAVDMEGLASRRPEYRSFTAHTLSPRVEIDIPRRNQFNPAQVPPITTFRWTATDFISDMRLSQDPDSVSYLLEPLVKHNNSWNETIAWIRDLPVDSPEWGDWVWYGAPEDSGKTWTTPPNDLGQYVFAIRALDEAGAITPVFDEDYNMRRVLVSRRKTGPKLTVQNLYMGTVVTNICNHPLSILDMFAGIPLEFNWEADATDYGGTVVGYRYGWDITNLDDPEQWEVSFTPFPPTGPGELPRARSTPRTFYFGTHVFTIEVQDNSGFCSRIEVKVNIVQFRMTKGLLIVDDYVEPESGGWNGTGKGVEPNDVEHDAFWNSMASDVAGFNPLVDVEDVTGRLFEGIPLDKIANYKSIIWSVRGGLTSDAEGVYFHDLVRYRPKEGERPSGKQQPNAVALFMAAGGHMMIAGHQPISMVLDKAYTPTGIRIPLIWKYEINLEAHSQSNPPTPEMIEDPPGDQTLAYLDLCTETMDIAVTDFRIRRNVDQVCPASGTDQRFIPPGDYNEYKRTRSMRAAAPLDLNFPRLELRPETAGPGKAHAPELQGLNTEVYNPQYFFDDCRYIQGSRDCFEPIYGLECFYTEEPTFMQPIAFWTSTHADVVAEAPGAIPARSVVFGFQPVLCDTVAVRTAIENVLFDEWKLPRK
jgi:hypothetical protein